MKRTWMATFCIIAAAMPALAAGITVKTPAAGETIEIGTNKPVTWTFSGLPNTTKVKLVLWQSGASLGIIAENLAIGSNGQGSYNWKAGDHAGGPAKAGAGYRIRVRTMDESLSAFGPIFTLSAKPADPGKPPTIISPIQKFPSIGLPCMTVTSPKAGDVADPYNPVNIKWTKNGNLDANVSITMKRTGKGAILPGVTLAASTENDGFFGWDPTPLVPAPGMYTVTVRTLDGKCAAVSEEFMMKEMGGIEILSPKGGEVWESGTSHAVTWKRLGNVQTLEIQLSREGSWLHTLVQGVDAKLGSKTCTFVRGDTDGAKQICYKVFINHSGGTTVNPSGCFTLTGNPELAIANVGFSGLFNVGQDMTFSVKVENKGAAASQPCQGSLKVNGVSAKTFALPAIPAGGSLTVPVIWKVACPGKIVITIDTGGANVEADKANNVWGKDIC